MIGIVGGGTMGARLAPPGEPAVVLDPQDDPAALAGARLVLDLVHEDLPAKRARLAALSAAAPDAVLLVGRPGHAVSAVAGAAADPARVAGLHVVGPVAEVVAGLASSAAAVAAARRLAEALGRTPLEAADGPGFLLARCARPLFLEAAALLEEGLADAATIDRLLRAAGFASGAFALAERLGATALHEQAVWAFEAAFGEPRWRPSRVAARHAAAGCPWHGPDAAAPPEDTVREPGGGDGRLVVVSGLLPVAEALRDAASDAGWDVADVATGEVPHLILDLGREPEDPPLEGGPQALLVAEAPLHALDPGGTACGFHAVAPLGPLVEVTARQDAHAARFEAFVRTLGREPVRVGDAPGLVVGRVLAQLVNEAAFALGEGAGTAEAIDLGLEQAMGHPQGPLSWADELHPLHVLMVLDGLREHLGTERYRAAPTLRRAADEDLALAG